MKDLLHSLGMGTNTAAVLIAAASFLILYLLGLENWLGISFSVISGLVAGVVIGQPPNITHHRVIDQRKVYLKQVRLVLPLLL